MEKKNKNKNAFQLKGCLPLSDSKSSTIWPWDDLDLEMPLTLFMVLSKASISKSTCTMIEVSTSAHAITLRHTDTLQFIYRCKRNFISLWKVIS